MFWRGTKCNWIFGLAQKVWTVAQNISGHVIHVFWFWTVLDFVEELLLCSNTAFLLQKYWFLVHSATVHCTHHAAPFHSGIPRIKLSFYYSSTIILYIFKIYRAHLLKLHWRARARAHVFIFSIFDENNFEQIPHRVNVANVFFTCMRFLRIAYPNLFLEMCVHGGMLAHFSTLKCFFSTTLKAMLLHIHI